MCTIMGCSGCCAADGAAWLASTSDNPYREGPRKPVVLTVAYNGRRFVHTPCLKLEPDGSFTDCGSDRGLNNAGLAWTRSWVVPAEAQSPDAPTAQEWFMRLAAECATVSDALAFVAQTPKRQGCQGNYMFADALGGFACVEVGYQTVQTAVVATNGAPATASRTNLYVLPQMAALDISADANPDYASTSAVRRSRAETLLQNTCGHLGLAAWQAILADTKYLCLPPESAHGPSICSAGTVHGTVSAEIMHPATASFYYTYGWTNPSVSLDAGYTGETLASWGQWRRFCPDAMEPGAYTTWLGELTPLGQAYCGPEAYRA